MKKTTHKPRKLALERSTVRVLSANDLRLVSGGGPGSSDCSSNCSSHCDTRDEYCPG